MLARPLQRPCPHGREQTREHRHQMRVHGLCPRTFTRLARVHQINRESKAFAGLVSRLVPGLEFFAQVAQEASGKRAVDEAVVVRERQVHDRAIAITSSPSSSCTTHGRFTTAYVPRIAACGWLITGVPWNVP